MSMTTSRLSFCATLSYYARRIGDPKGFRGHLRSNAFLADSKGSPQNTGKA
jgi:hypothetical protein